MTFTIHEGQRIYVNRVLVAGREFTRPYVVEHELEVAPNDPLSQSDLLESQQKLYDRRASSHGRSLQSGVPEVVSGIDR